MIVSSVTPNKDSTSLEVLMIAIEMTTIIDPEVWVTSTISTSYAAPFYSESVAIRSQFN
jgi:hypothetical protein